MFEALEAAHKTLQDHFYAHQMLWWGVLAAVALGGVLLSYAMNRHEQKVNGR